ncbi:MAG TPA: glutamate--cysteine ligase [Gammaproteobacteria bacterium]
MQPEDQCVVPHLTTALSGPLLQLESHLLAQQPRIEAWLRRQWTQVRLPFYSSVDLRNAGFKLAPVDTNLFPAGFNNLNPSFLPLCVQAIQAAVERQCPTAASILLIPESHTRNLFYLESVATLTEILGQAGFTVRIGTLLEEPDGPLEFSLPSGRALLLEPLRRAGRRIGVDGFDPCMVLLNNDLAGGRPAILEDLEQPVVPPLGLGWSNRLKSRHFAYYQAVANEFAELVGLDPWLFDPLSRNCGEIDFMKREGEDCLARNIDVLLQAIELKYREYGIDKRPFVIVKADAGTYGMGIMTAHSSEEVRALNRKQRTRMAASKSGISVTRVIMQEGVYTFEDWNGAVAEPVVYMIDRFVVGGFYRVHTARGANENLNAPGMHFEALAFAASCNTPDLDGLPDAGPNRFYAYGVIARLALLAASRELAEH